MADERIMQTIRLIFIDSDKKNFKSPLQYELNYKSNISRERYRHNKYVGVKNKNEQKFHCYFLRI